MYETISPKGGVKMRKYEIMFIVRPDLEEANIKEVANNMKEVLKSEGATIVEEKAMGQRELAYEIKKYKMFTCSLSLCIGSVGRMRTEDRQ